jgi:hypothetical protein
MNLRRKKPHDSLYMLLDTMCDAFGGIILLAVLVVLLTNTERTQSATAGERQEGLERRLALAQTNLEESLALAASLEAKANSQGLREQVALLDTRRQLQDELDRTREAAAGETKAVEAFDAADPTDRLKQIEAELAAAEKTKANAQNRFAADQEEAKRLQLRRVALEELAVAKIKDMERPLRLPKEYQTGKRVTYFIARYGKIYPCRNADLSRNETDLKWSSRVDDEIAEPIPGKGVDPANGRELQNYFAGQSKEDIYAAFCVFEDSFPAFIRARQIVGASGFAYGWEPFRLEDGPVRFSPHGHQPKPQ